jgi:hypothetical protein
MEAFEALLVSKEALNILKIMILFGVLIYMAFSLLVIRQTQLMTRTITGKLDRSIRVISWIHFLITVFIFLVGLIAL